MKSISLYTLPEPYSRRAYDEAVEILKLLRQSTNFIYENRSPNSVELQNLEVARINAQNIPGVM